MVLGGAAWLAAAGRAPGWLCWAGAGFALLALQAGIWAALDRSWVAPGRALAREIRLLLHANAERPIRAPEGHGLGELAEAIVALAEGWRRGHAEQSAALASATARAASSSAGSKRCCAISRTA